MTVGQMGVAAPTHTRTYRRLVANTTINNTTLLSTDYLNHFNEVIMLLDLCADMPEMIDEVKAWKPKSYAQHFRDSVFSHKTLAVAAFDHAPAEYRIPFDETVAELNREVADAVARVDAALAAGDQDMAVHIIRDASRALQKGVDKASGIINGVSAPPVDTEDTTPTTVMDQADIDALFD